MEKAAVSLAVAAVSPIFGKVCEKIGSNFGGDITSKEIDELRYSIIPKIQMVLTAAGTIKVDQLKPWLMELKVAVYNADDVLDEYEYRLIKDKVNPSIKKYLPKTKKLDFLPKEIKKLALKSKLKSSFENLKKKAIEAEKLIPYFDIVTKTNTTQSESSDYSTKPPVTDATPPPRIIGRDYERDFLISKLLKEADDSSSSYSTSSESNIPVYAIHALGGAGKTTLAQLIYNDPRIANSFFRIWIHVGLNFDVYRIVKEIIQVSAQNINNDITNPTALIEKLKESLNTKRFLLILDDVWCEDIRRLDKFLSEWNKLLVPMNQVGGVNSRVLITTRTGELASYLGGENSHSLEELTTEDCLCILKHYALGNADEDIQNLQLKNLAGQIVNRLQKSPLAAKVIGSSLKRKVDARTWEQFLKDDMLKDSVMDALLLSFNYLPHHLQRCFALCSLYPRGFEIRDLKELENLIRLWIALGLVELPSVSNLTLEDMGMKYFDDLVSYSFFQVNPINQGGFLMHDLVHHLAEKVSEDHCIRIEDEWPESIPATIMHLSVSNSSFFRNIPDTAKLANLRTFINFTGTEDVSSDFSREFFKKLTKLRVLDLGYISTDELFTSVCKLKHLRYLKLNQGVLESIGRLYHLQFLMLAEWGTTAVKIRKGLENLLNLRCIDGRWDPGDAVSKFHGFGKLTSIQILKEYHVGRTGEDGIEQLRNLNDLRGSLKISGLENVKDKEAAEEAMMKKKRGLHHLTLNWESSGEGGNTANEQQALEGLEPPPNLKILEIDNYKGAKSPEWMLNNTKCLSNLQSLTISGSHNLKELPSLPPGLCELTIFGCRSLTELPSLPQGLCKLTIFGCRSLTELPSLHDGLLELTVDDCPNLSQVLSLPPKLCKLIVTECPKLMQVPFLPDSLRELTLENYPDLKELPSLSHALTKLVINDCTNLVQVPSLPHSLKVLRVGRCPQLRQLSPFSHSLEKVWINGSPSIKSLISSIPDDDDDNDDDDDEIMKLQKKQNKGASYQYPSSLTHLRIERPCVAINEKKLNKFLQNQIRLNHLTLQGLLGLTHLCLPGLGATYLWYIKIRDCLDIVSLQGIGSLPNLNDLNIIGCPKLKTVISDEVGGHLPSSLFNLEIDSGSMKSRDLSRCLLGLINLNTLKISGRSFDCFPDLSGLEKLHSLTISKCPELTWIGNFTVIKSLKSVTILECPALTTALQRGGSKEEEIGCMSVGDDLRLEVDEPLVLPVLLGKKALSSLRHLTIQQCSQLDISSNKQIEDIFMRLTSLSYLEFRGCANLRSLPVILKKMSSLRWLHINNCPAIESLPTLPASLPSLWIFSCPRLKEKYGEGGSLRHRINQIKNKSI